MAINERARASVELDGQQAQSQLQQLKAQAAEMRKELKQLKMDKDPEYANKKRQFDSLNAEIKKLNKSSFDLNATLRNLSGATLKDLTRAQSVLTAQIRQTDRSTREGQRAFAKKTQQLQRVKAEISQVRMQMNGLNQGMGIFQKMAQGFNRYFGMIGAGIASFTGVIMGLRSTIKVFNDYEESVANLSAITGLAGYQLDWLSERAKEASIATKEGGIRFSNSAKEIVDAYTMVGSKRPELLANREALASVTEEAMILSKAAKIDLGPAATALTTVMNQFNESADQANRIINVLGAGSKVGAGNVAYLNDVIEKSGTSAKGAGLSVEQLVGTIEGIAPKFSEPARAGTMLRNVFVRLQNIDDDLNPTIVGWDKALENLANRQYTTTEITKLFGLESFTMIQALIDGRADIEKYTEAVTGSSIANEQAAINSATNAAKLDQARNKAQLLRIELGEKLAPALTFSTNGFSYLLKGVKIVMDEWDKYRRILLILIGLTMAYRHEKVKATAALLDHALTGKGGLVVRNMEVIKLNALIIKEAALTGWRTKGTIATKLATAAQKVFNVTVSMFPGFAIMAGIMAVIGALKLWDTHNKAAVERQKEHNRLMEENESLLLAAERAAKQVAHGVKNLNTLTAQDRISLWQRNQEKIRSLEIDLQQMRINKQLAMENAAAVSATQAVWASIRHSISGRLASIHMAKMVAKNMKEAGEEFTETISQMEQALNSLKGSSKDLDDIMTAEQRANKIMGDSVANLEEKISLYNLALRYAKINSEDYDRIKGLLTQTQQRLNQVMEEGGDILNGNSQDVQEASSAYSDLTKAISDTRAMMEHLVAVGDWDGAKAADLTLRNLQAQKTILDGIIESGGDVIAFLDEMADSTQAELEEMEAYNEQFMKDWGEASQKWQQQKDEQHQYELEQEIKGHEARVEMAKREHEIKRQLEEDLVAARREIMDASLYHGFQLFNMYANAEYDRRMTDMEKMRDKELSNESLTQEQRLAIEERYRKQEAIIKKEAFVRQKRADLIQSLINGFLAVQRALAAPPGFPLNAPSVITAGALAAIQTASIAAQPVPQYFKGRYPVKGASDGRIYHATYTGEPVTGIYSRPSLVAERGDELIVDAPTTKNIRLNYPHLLDAIYSVRVPQFASGRYPEPSGQSSHTGQPPFVSDNTDLIKSLYLEIKALNQINGRLLQEGVRGVWVYSDLMRFKQKVEDIEKMTRM